MGCGGVNRLKLFGDKELMKEVKGKLNKLVKGLHIDEQHQIETHKVLNKDNPIFKEELMDHADESGSVKPWIANIVAPEVEIVEKKTAPEASLKMEHVFGFRSWDVRQNLFFTDDKHICYMTGAVGIVQNVDNYSQKRFGGLECYEEGDCHDDDIVAIAFHKGEVSMVATGQRHLKPSIIIWSPVDPSVIYYTFHQTKGTKEVANLSFDKKGEYIASVGRDKLHTFFVFKLETNSLYWTDTTNSNAVLDLQFNPLGDEFCIVGVKKVFFMYVQRKMKRDGLIKNAKYGGLTFTAVAYTKEGYCLTSTSDGQILIWENCMVTKEIKICDDSIHNLTYNYITDRIYITDSEKFVHIAEMKKEISRSHNLTILDKFQAPSIVKALDVNTDGEIIMGMKDGTIIMKTIKGEQVVTRSHSEGRVMGLVYVYDRYVLSTGEDNRVMLWNINSFICEAVAPLTENAIDPKTKLPIPQTDAYAPNQCSQCITYNTKNEHVAIGLNSGHISIRRGIKKLKERVIPDVTVSNKAIVELKYCPSNKFLAVASENKDFIILNVELGYQKVANLKGHEDYIIQFDWDVSSKYLQAVTNDNCYLFFDTSTSSLISGKQN